MQYAEAAALCPRILSTDADAWERWVYTFGQAAQLPLLAPYLPTHTPLLSSSAYDLTLTACLLSPAGHELLRELVERWPAGCYDAAALLDKVTPRLRRFSSTSPEAPPVLRRVAAALHAQLNHHDEVVPLLLGLKSHTVFDYIKQHGLAALAATRAAELMELNEVRTTSMLIEAADEAPPEVVVASLQLMRMNDDVGGGGNNTNNAQQQQNTWSLRLYHYVDWLWQSDATAAAPFAELHVELCAAHDPDRLLHLLTTSVAYPLDSALRVCEAHNLVKESVFVLGRMGATDAALRLIVGHLRDVEGAVAFVQESRDDEMWDLLISLTLGDAALAGALLDHAGGGVDPLKLVEAIPEEMRIEGLRDRLVRVVGEFRAALSLQSGCNAVLRADWLELGDRLYGELRRALKQLHVLMPEGGGTWVEMYHHDTTTATTTGGGGNKNSGENYYTRSSSSGSSIGARPPFIDALDVENGQQKNGRRSRVWIGSVSKTGGRGGRSRSPSPVTSSGRRKQIASVHSSPSKYYPHSAAAVTTITTRFEYTNTNR